MKKSIKIITFFMILITALISIGCSGSSSDSKQVTYTVTFSSQFIYDPAIATVMPNPASITVNSGETVGTLPSDPSMSGYQFGGWWTGKNGTGSLFKANTTVTSDMIVYAYWFNHLVTFNNDGETYAIRGVILPAKTVSSLPTSPTKAGYYFIGWYTSSTGGTEFNASTELTADITVYARWSTNQAYTVIYDSQGGTAVGTQYVILPATTVVTLPAEPTRVFYTFGGWFLGPTGCCGAFTASTPVTSDTTVYANWIADPGYTVTYNSYGGTSVDPQYVILSSGNTVATGTTEGSLPTSPTKRCYSFAGWYTDTTYTTTFTASTTVGADITVYAKWAWDYPSTTYPLRTAPFEIGDYGPSCVGKVFYITDSGLHGLEAAPPNWYEAGEGPADSWIYGDPATDSDGQTYQQTQSTLNGNTSTAIGTGLANSNAIVAQAGATTTMYAAKLCLDYSVGEGSYLYNDWFLPSKDELAQLYLRRDAKRSGGFAEEGYWSSSEYGQWDAWSQYFDDGRQTGTYKSSGRLVRPVRAF